MINNDTIEKSISISNRFRDARLHLEMDENGPYWTDAGGITFDFNTLDEARCFIQGYEFMKVPNNE